MDLYLKNRKHTYNAHAKYDEESGKFIVLAGSLISDSIAQGTFRSAKSIEKLRLSGCVENGILNQNLSFNSASSAANFVTGVSTNGKLAWKNAEGMPLKNLL